MSETVKLWHDDIRRPPDDSWTWARTNREAMLVLLNKEVVEASLDHDLGMHESDPDEPEAYLMRGASPEGSGFDLAIAMYALRCVPPKVTIHTWNIERAEWMAGVLREAGGEVIVKPWKHVLR